MLYRCEQVRSEYEDSSSYGKTPDMTLTGREVHYLGKNGELLGASLASQGTRKGGAVVSGLSMSLLNFKMVRFSGLCTVNAVSQHQCLHSRSLLWAEFWSLFGRDLHYMPAEKSTQTWPTQRVWCLHGRIFCGLLRGRSHSFTFDIRSGIW